MPAQGRRREVCQDFSWKLSRGSGFDRKFRGEILKISPLKLQNLSPKFAVKLSPIYTPLIISMLQKPAIFLVFVKIFDSFYPPG